MLNTGVALTAAKFAEAIAKGDRTRQIEGEKTRQAVATEPMKPLADLIKTAQEGELDLTNPEHFATYFEHEEKIEKLRKNHNLTSIFLLAHDETKEEKISEEPLNTDWFTKFRNYAQDASDEQMQELWARILSEEIKASNSISIRTADMLSKLSKTDLELIEKAASLELHERINEIALHITSNDGPLGSDALSFEDIHHLHEVGVLAEVTPNTRYLDANLLEFILSERVTSLNIGAFKMKSTILEIGDGDLFCFLAPYGTNKLEHHMGAKFTKAGVELLKIARIPLKPIFIEQFLVKMHGYGFDQKFHLSGHLEKKFRNKMLQASDIVGVAISKGVDFNRYRVDPSEAEDTPS